LEVKRWDSSSLRDGLTFTLYFSILFWILGRSTNDRERMRGLVESLIL